MIFGHNQELSYTGKTAGTSPWREANGEGRAALTVARGRIRHRDVREVPRAENGYIRTRVGRRGAGFSHTSTTTRLPPSSLVSIVVSDGRGCAWMLSPSGRARARGVEGVVCRVRARRRPRMRGPPYAGKSAPRPRMSGNESLDGRRQTMCLCRVEKNGDVPRSTLVSFGGLVCRRKKPDRGSRGGVTV